MIIKSLHLENFQNIEKADLEFIDGITVFNGPNASGKSSVLAAIGFCLSEMRRGDSWEDYVQSGKNYFYIEMVAQFEKPMTFKYRGEIRSTAISVMSKHINYDGKDYYNSECKTFLDTILDVSMIDNIIFTLQDSPSITKLRPLERRDIFKKIFNSDFTESVEAIRTEVQSLRTIQTTLQAEIDALASKTYTLNRLEIQDPLVLEKLLKQKEVALEVQEQNQKARLIAEQTDSHRSLLLRHLEEKGRTEKTLSEEEERLDCLAQDRIHLQTEITASEQSVQVHESEIQKAQGSIPLIQKEIEVCNVDVEHINLELTNTTESFQRARAEVIQNTLHLETHKAGSCSKCGQACESSHMPALEQAIVVAQARCDMFDTTLKDLNHQREVHLQKLTTQKSSLRDCQETVRRHQWELTASSKERERMRRRLDELNMREVETRKTISHHTATLALLQSQIDEETQWLASNSQIVDVVDVSQEIVTIDSEIAEYNKVTAINAERDRQNQDILVEKEESEALIKTKAENKEARLKEEMDLDVTKTVYEVHLPNHVNSKACILCEKYMNKFLAQTKDSFQVKLTPTKRGIGFTYQPRVTCGFINAKQASGFESAILTLAFKAAIAYASGSELFVLDEPDKDADSDSSIRFFETLLSINSGFRQMIVITHRSGAVSFLQDNGASVYEVEEGVFTRRV